MDDQTSPPVPAGFRRVKIPGNFITLNGPMYACMEGDRFVSGFRVEPRHDNATGVCQGGMLMTLVDMQLWLAAFAQEGIEAFLPTINLSCDFVAPAKVGAWIEGRTSFLKTSRNYVFADCVLSVEGAPVLRGNGMLKILHATEAPYELPDLLED
ncbi:MAG: PaaI family thioesterase [Alphaproteobacteria bacterium]|jgi:acyl-coenzyme A thioesterase PaaI-like protein|nr:PaaI family thioesterase [Alphaproteobacteria bacterium]MDP7604145.1 PaaI family thioesterase [Alphaproteobacteria bacterium]HJP20643.1 PaaI family thioesterase [Alphaproteobacteria bacterium]